MTGFEKEVIDRLARIETTGQDTRTDLQTLRRDGCMKGENDRARLEILEKGVLPEVWKKLNALTNGKRKKLAMAGGGIVLGAGAITAIVEGLKALFGK